VQNAGPAIVGLGASFVAFRGSVALARAELAGFSKALGAVALIPVAAGIGRSLGQYIDDQLSSARGAALKQLEKLNQDQLKAFTDSLNERRDLENRADQDRV